MAGEALREEGAVPDATEVREAAAGDRETPAPGVLDAHVGELGKHLQHVAAHEGAEIARRPIAVGLASTEDQASVRGQAVVVHHELARVHAAVGRNQGRGAGRAERLGREEMVCDRHDPGTDLGHEAAEVGVAAEQHVACPHPALTGVHQRATIPSDFGRPGLFIQARSGRDRGAREAEREVERMEMGAAGVELASAVAFARHHLPHLVAIQHAEFRVVVVRGEVLGLPLKLRQVAPSGDREQVARLPVAVDAVALHPLAEQRLCFFGQVPERAGARASVARFELQHRASWRWPLPTCPPFRPDAGRSPAHARRLEQRSTS